MKNLLLIILFTATSFAQVSEKWVQRYSANGGGASAMIIDSQGNVIVTGNFYLTGGNVDIVTIKYNSEGVQQWLQTYFAGSQGRSTAIAVDEYDNIIITGSSNENVVTIKYNSAGNQEWVKTYNGPLNDSDRGLAIAIDMEGNAYVTGYVGTMSSSLEGGEERDIITIKYSSSGAQLWEKIYGSHANQSQRDVGLSIQVDQLDNVYVAGYTTDDQNNTNALTLKYDGNGNLVWDEIYTPPANGSVARNIMVFEDENIYVSGSTASTQGGGDFLLIKYNSAGSTQWVQTYSGPGSYGDVVNSMAIDSSGNIYVTGVRGDDYSIVTIKYAANGTQSWLSRNTQGYPNYNPHICVDKADNVYVTVESHSSNNQPDILTFKYDSTGQQKWFINYTGIGSPSYDRPSHIALDSADNIFVCGGSGSSYSSGGDFVTIKYTQGLRITEPQAGEKWIAGETDTIKWKGPKENGWEIFISDNDGFSYQSLNVILPADDTMFVWTPPDSFETSSYYRIKVIDALNNDIFAESEQFTIRSYDLVRITSDGKYEVYKPSLHGWSVVNYRDYIWPPSWYNQYDYRAGEDPFTGEPYSPKFAILTRAKSSDFPDWLTFVETFGVEKCYEVGFLSGNPYQPKQRAMEAWSMIKMDYDGACFGFPSSALLAFEQSTEFFAQNNLLQPTPTIFDLTSLIPIRKTIIKYFLYQSDSTSLVHDRDNFTKSVRETLGDIKEMLINDNGPQSVLSLQPPVPGGHAVIPHKLIRDQLTEGQYNLYVYDPNSPGENRELILLDSLGNTWQEFLDLDYGIASDGLFLGLPITHFLQVPILELLEKSNTASSKKDAGALADLSSVSLYTQVKSDIIIFTHAGDSLGYVSGNLIRKMANAGPIIPAVGGFTPPIGYTMTSANYSLWLSQFEDSLSTFLFSEDGILYRYERLNPQLNQIDKFTLGDGITVYGDEEKEILLRSIGGNNKEIVYELSNITIMAGDSLRTIHSPGDDLLVSNKGSNKFYDLRVQQLDSYQAIEFEHYNISLSENTTHYLSLVDSLLTSIRILIDIGNDGTIDDTIYAANTVDVKDERSLLSPKSYNLAQNYPNPFNPSTKISWQSPVGSHQTMKVYDVLGNEVATLVDEYREAGRYEITFDASQLASGIYLYKLQAGSFVETKKMILLR